MACTPFDGLRLAAEKLGETLHLRASWQDIWFSAIKKEAWGLGSGLVKSNFEIGRSEPSDEEIAVAAVTTTDGEDAFTGSCGTTYTGIEVGFKEKTYKPVVFGLNGPLLCQDDLGLHWNTARFWEKYITAMEKNVAKTIMHLRRNVYMEYVPKAACRTDFTWVAGDFSTQPPLVANSGVVDLSGVSEPTCDITQQYLDATAPILAAEGATDPDSNGWINLGPLGPEFLLLIGMEASKRIWTNNAELRQDARDAFSGREYMSPLLKRIGASTVIGNFRHVVTLDPPRWRYANGAFTRVNAYTMSSAADDATKGSVAIRNSNYDDPTYANVEGAIVLSPNVYTEQPLQPMNTAPGMKWNPQNYTGDWDFVTGYDAINGFCTPAPQDPKHKLGRHVAEYRAAFEPVFPTHGRLILFSRCPQTYTCVTCS